MPLSFHPPQPEDVSRTRRLLLECSRYLRGGELYPDCQFDPARPCRHIPPACTRYNAVYTILHFLADDKFMLPGVSGGQRPGRVLKIGRFQQDSFLAGTRFY